MNCIFCSDKVTNNKFSENDLAYAVYDIFPKSKGHALIIPKRHSENFFEMTEREKVDCFKLLDEVKKLLNKEHKPDGYNILVNCGKDAGQVVFHTHVHLIPRYKGDNVLIDSNLF